MIKKITLIILTISFTTVLKAQINSIPNAGFENWTSMGSYEVPNQWGNLNTTTASNNVYTAIKGSPGSPGNYYIKLITKNAGGVLKPGIIVSGDLDPQSLQAKSGFPFTQQVKNLKGKYQFMGYGTDVATIAAWLTRWDQVLMHRDTIASLYRNTSGMLHVWTAFSFPFTYTSTELPDTAIVYISSSSGNPVEGSFIWLDDLAFEGTVTAAKDLIPSDVLNLYPCPAKEFIMVEFTSRKPGTSALKILDAQGKIVLVTNVDVISGPNSLKIDLSRINTMPGLYYLQCKSPDGIITKQFIIGK